jgi:hypothetical protein
MSERAIVRIVVGITLAGLAWLALYWWASVAEHRVIEMRSRVTQVVRAATACRDAVAAFYAANRRMPSGGEAQCPPESVNVSKPAVAGGVITLAATGALAQKLAANESGTQLRYAPSCRGPCNGAPIATWDCKSGTTIDPRYLPAGCR